MKIFACLLSVLLLASCTARETQTYDIYGNQSYSLTCNLTEKQLCIDEAYKTCPKGYYLIDEDDSGYIFKSILIRCKA